MWDTLPTDIHETILDIKYTLSKFNKTDFFKIDHHHVKLISSTQRLNKLKTFDEKKSITYSLASLSNDELSFVHELNNIFDTQNDTRQYLIQNVLHF